MKDPYAECRLCPRLCRADRNRTEGFCKSGTRLKISSAVLHKGEEPPISGSRGSGAVFFTGCTLGCSFCQNYQISANDMGTEQTEQEFVQILLDLQNKGAHNINFVTGTHFIPGIAKCLSAARKSGLTIPAVWNTSGFESEEGLAILSDCIDIFLPDIKTVDPCISARILGTESYARNIIPAIEKMIVPPVYDEQGLMKKGTITRHLVLPGLSENTRQVLELFSEKFRDRALISLMVQYAAPSGPALSDDFPDRMKKRSGGLSPLEYDELIEWLDLYKIEEGFVQDLSDDYGWLPDFKRYNPFPGEYSEVVWHWER